MNEVNINVAALHRDAGGRVADVEEGEYLWVRAKLQEVLPDGGAVVIAGKYPYRVLIEKANDLRPLRQRVGA